jgi:citrate synthase
MCYSWLEERKPMKPHSLSAKEAAEQLGIRLPTLYAYVSRGLIRSETIGDGRRDRRYSREDVERLQERKEQRRDPSRVVETALQWGTPVLDSALTLIADGRLYYRGRDAVELATRHTIEEVATLLWAGDRNALPTLFGTTPEGLSPRCLAVSAHIADLAPIEAFQTLLPLAAAEDRAAYDLRPAAVARTGARILRLLTTIATGGHSGPMGIAQRLQQAWRPEDPPATALLDAALILCADHELNVSTFTARCVASAGATPYAAVIAGLSALQGGKHGGQGERVEALFREVGAPGKAQATLAGRLRRGESLPGFGHPLYPQGDPRGTTLMALVHAAAPDAPDMDLAAAIAEAAADLIDERPNVDFGLITLSHALALPPGAAMALFAIGRTVGWIGHAIEQAAQDRLIRPRARYIGEPPKENGESF